MTLWVFGDSFAASDNRESTATWVELTAQNLSTDVKNHSGFGWAHGHIRSEFLDHWRKINAEDRVIFVLAGCHKYALFDHHRDLTAKWIIDKRHYNHNLQAMEPAKQRAFIQFFDHLTDRTLARRAAEETCLLLDFISLTHHIPILVLKAHDHYPGIQNENYQNLIVSQGRCLADLSKSELEYPSINPDSPWCKETRNNHLNVEHHRLVSTAVTQAFTLGRCVI